MASWIYSDTGSASVLTTTRHFYVWPDKSIIEFSNAYKSIYWVKELIQGFRLHQLSSQSIQGARRYPQKSEAFVFGGWRPGLGPEDPITGGGAELKNTRFSIRISKQSSTAPRASISTSADTTKSPKF